MKILWLFICLPLYGLAQENQTQIKEFVGRGDMAAAEKLYSGSPSFKSDLSVIELMGDGYGAVKEWDKALTYYGILIDKVPGSAEYHYKYAGVLGMKALSVSKVKGLMYVSDLKKHFGLAASLDPNHIEARWALIDLYLQLPGILGGSYKKAEDYARQLGKISEMEGHLAMGYIADYKGDSKMAELHFKDAMKYVNGVSENYPRNNINYQIGKISAKYGVNPEKGMEHLSRFLKRHTMSDFLSKEWAYYQMSVIQMNVKNKKGALDLVNQALNLKPDFEEARDFKKKIMEM